MPALTPDDLSLWLASARAKVEAAGVEWEFAPSSIRRLGLAQRQAALLAHLPALLDVAEAAARVAELNDPANPVLAADVLPAWDALDAALARLAKGGE